MKKVLTELVNEEVTELERQTPLAEPIYLSNECCL